MINNLKKKKLYKINMKIKIWKIMNLKFRKTIRLHHRLSKKMTNKVAEAQRMMMKIFHIQGKLRMEELVLWTMKLNLFQVIDFQKVKNIIFGCRAKKIDWIINIYHFVQFNPSLFILFLMRLCLKLVLLCRSTEKILLTLCFQPSIRKA